MTPEELKALETNLGAQTAAQIKKETDAIQTKMKELETAAKANGGITKEDFDSYKTTADAALEAVKDIARKQGVTLTELSEKLVDANAGTKSVGQVLEESKKEMETIYKNRNGVASFMVNVNSKGEFVAKPLDETKDAGPHATIDGLGGVGTTGSVSQSIDAATLLRLGGNSPIISQYRNTPWVFDLCNVQNAAYSTNMPFAMWYEEKPKEGGSNLVLEGGTKPKTQYLYELKTASYKKEATLIGFTEEFTMDFARLQSDIMGKGRTDVINRINAVLLADLTSKATAYNTAAEFNGGVGITNVNDFDALAAMAAQVDNSTYGNLANAAVMSTFKKYNMGISKTTQGDYLNRPAVLDNLSFVSNPDMGADDVMVGDFKKYNILLRGGFIIRVGYNGTDFAENKFSTVMEQFYYNYMSAIHQPAIVKGATFSAVKAAIAA